MNSNPSRLSTAVAFAAGLALGAITRVSVRMAPKAEQRYLMNPETDQLISGHDLENGMVVLAEDVGTRVATTQDSARVNTFHTVTHYRNGGLGYSYVARYSDEYEESRKSSGSSITFLVKTYSLPSALRTVGPLAASPCTSKVGHDWPVLPKPGNEHTCPDCGMVRQCRRDGTCVYTARMPS
jgi:hypothetical protein